jgi:hypothetical protein
VFVDVIPVSALLYIINFANFPTLQVATTCFSRGPPEVNLAAIAWFFQLRNVFYLVEYVFREGNRYTDLVQE